MAERVREKIKTAKGIYRVHSRTCAAGAGRRCNCEPSFQATVYSVRDDKLLRKHFDGQKEAELWRGEIRGAVADGTRRGSVSAARSLMTLRRRQEQSEPEDPEVEGLPENHPWRWVLEGDPLVALTPDAMAELTPSQRAHAIAVSEAHTAEALRRSSGNGGQP